MAKIYPSTSEFERECDADEAICPYCQHRYQPESEDYSEDSREIECDECGKKFHLHQSFVVWHHTQPDCALNGTEHVWQSRNLKNSKVHEFCNVCDKCKPYEQSAVSEEVSK